MLDVIDFDQADVGLGADYVWGYTDLLILMSQEPLSVQYTWSQQEAQQN